MAASAALTIPVKLSSPVARAAALDVLTNAAGSSGVSIDSTGSSASLRLEVPGALDKIVAKLAHKGVMLGGWVRVEIPVRPYPGIDKEIDPTYLVTHLNMSPAVREAAFDGKTVSATVYPSTSAMRYLFEELLVTGLQPIDAPTPAGPQDFVL